jgi:hypothetical protein
MTNISEAELTVSGERAKLLVFGTAIGAALGLAGAFLLARNLERSGTELKISSGEGLRLGVLLLGVLRQIATLNE